MKEATCQAGNQEMLAQQIAGQRIGLRALHQVQKHLALVDQIGELLPRPLRARRRERSQRALRRRLPLQTLPERIHFRTAQHPGQKAQAVFGEVRPSLVDVRRRRRQRQWRRPRKRRRGDVLGFADGLRIA